MAFTKEQQLAIDSEGKNIIVSAGAGSGKTAVLTERVIRKLKNGILVDHLLVLTFTNEAAKEMKSRIRKAIIKNGLTENLDLLDSAYITTFDSFALSLVKKYHYLLDISNNIKIIDGGLVTLYKYQAIDTIFDSMYGNSKFDKLIGDFCLKDDTLIKKYIIDLSNKLDLLTDKDGYLNNYFERFYHQTFLDTVTNEYINLIQERIVELDAIYHKFTSYANDKLINELDNYFKPLFSGNNYDDYCLFKTMTIPRFTGVSELGLEYKEEIKVLVSDILKLLRFDNIKAIHEALNASRDYADVIIEIIRKLDNLVNSYKARYEIYEFNDISHMANKLVRDNLSVRIELKSYFNEIMVDEYQDTSDIQEEFINYIANNNLYMVGDIKQSIYRFRNANPYIFRDKYSKYSKNIDGMKIDLLKNFRSRKETLYNINEIFNLIMDDHLGDANYLASHNMEYGNTLYDNEDTLHNNYLEIYNYANDLSEYSNFEKELFIIADDIIDKIKNKYQVFDKDTGKLRDLKYSDICIITDRNKYLVDYKKILEYKEIPSVIYMDQELYDNMVVLVLKNLIKLVYYANNHIYDDHFRYAYTSVMRSFIFDYDDDKIFHVLEAKKYYQDDIIKLCLSINLDMPLVTFINTIIDKFKIYEALTNLAHMEENIICIDNLVNIASDLSDIGLGINEFINYLDDTSKAEIGIKYAVGTNKGDAVKIMNIHKSKGLEFSLCYFTGLDNKFSIRDINSKFLFSQEYGMILPYLNDAEVSYNILRDLYTHDYYMKEISEKIRLLYVALTRCREKMIILANIGEDMLGYHGLVPDAVRLKYRSFLDIFKSLNLVNKYFTYKEAKCSRNYLKINIKNIDNSDNKSIITKYHLDIEYEETIKNNYAKNKGDILCLEEIKKMEYGTKVHELFEYDDFFNPQSSSVKKLLAHLPKDFLKVYHEYEFEYNLDNGLFRGIIDLLIEYIDCFYIIDYKLKNISDSDYIKQLNGYRDYLKQVTAKDIKTFLYSVTLDDLKEVK